MLYYVIAEDIGVWYNTLWLEEGDSLTSITNTCRKCNRWVSILQEVKLAVSNTLHLFAVGISVSRVDQVPQLIEVLSFPSLFIHVLVTGCG